MYKYVNDYVPKLQEMFPYLDKKDIIRCVNYGWRMFYYYNLRNLDTLNVNNKYNVWMYCGELRKNPLKHFDYYKMKLRKKIRFLYLKKHGFVHSNIYYTYITEEEYKRFFKKKGRPMTKFPLNNRQYFKILEEAKIYYDRCKYIIQFEYICDMGYSFSKKELIGKNVKLVFTRDKPATFEDILVSNNDNYEQV